MPRRPAPLHPSEGPLEFFAAELRSLRDRAGSNAPSIESISAMSGLPRSTLYAVLKGTRVPRDEVLVALVRAWGGDEAVWLSKRTRLQEELRAQPEPPSGDLQATVKGLNSLADLPQSMGVVPNPSFLEMLNAVDAAAEVFTFHSERVPAPLQSQQYALVQYRLVSDDARDVDVLRARARRLRIFTQERPPWYRALLTESSLLRAPGGSEVIVREQAQYLLDLLENYPRFSLRVIHYHARLAYIDADFTLIKGRSRLTDMVYLPYGLDGRLIRARRGIDEREAYWHMANEAALSADDSKKFLHELVHFGKAG